jgi:leucyl aminopeptidase
VHPHLAAPHSAALPINFTTPQDWEQAARAVGEQALAFARATGFEAKPGTIALLPGPQGAVQAVLFGADPAGDPMAAGALPNLLPDGVYRFATPLKDEALSTLAFLLGAYRFTAYKTQPAARHVQIVPGPSVDAADLSRIAHAIAQGRHIINMPANDYGPAEIEDTIRRLASCFGAHVTSIIGDDLLAQNYPMVHAVGRASPRAPRLIDMTWGDPSHPKVTLVGKGVAFDTGGLNIKPDSAMLLMKKDMGGAATAIAAAEMIMAAKRKVRLRLIVAAVENSISGSSFRPGDILPSRKGITVEIGNTDAEGRLILGDALALADDEAPALLLDFATLTGAARVALGPDLPPFYTQSDELAAAITQAGDRVADPVWRMPLWKPYDQMLSSKVADVNHISSGAFAGSITAALFLKRFVERTEHYAHFDVYGWVPTTKPGRPEGGEPQVARLVDRLIMDRFGA